MCIPDKNVEACVVGRDGLQVFKKNLRAVVSREEVRNQSAARWSGGGRCGQLAKIRHDSEAPLPIDSEPGAACREVAAR